MVWYGTHGMVRAGLVRASPQVSACACVYRTTKCWHPLPGGKSWSLLLLRWVTKTKHTLAHGKEAGKANFMRHFDKYRLAHTPFEGAVLIGFFNYEDKKVTTERVTPPAGYSTHAVDSVEKPYFWYGTCL